MLDYKKSEILKGSNIWTDQLKLQCQELKRYDSLSIEHFSKIPSFRLFLLQLLCNSALIKCDEITFIIIFISKDKIS